MPTSSYYNRVVFIPTNGGTSAFTVRSAAPGARTPADASIPNGTTVSYTAVAYDLTQWECGQGTYSAGVLTRTTLRDSSTGAFVNFTFAPTVQLDFLAQDITQVFNVVQSLPPIASTDKAITRWSGTTGLLLQNSTVILDDTGNVFLPSGTKLDWGAANYTLTHSSGNLLASGPFNVGDTKFQLNFSAGVQPFLLFDTLDYLAFTRATNTFVLGIGGTDTVGVSSNLFFPPSTDVVALGSSSQRFSNLFLKSGGKVDFGNGDVTETHSSGQLVWQGAISYQFRGTGAGANVQTLITPQTLGNAGIEHGRQDGVASTPFFDFHSGATAVDYDSRIIASGGTGVVGAGTLTIAAGTFAVTATTDLQQQILYSGDISPTSIGADQNDYNPTNLATSSVLRLTSSGAFNITGLAGGADGRIVIIHNIGGNNITLKDESVSSSAANRFALTSDVILSTDSTAALQYDSTSTRWRVVGGSGGGASAAEPFVTIGNSAGLSAERALTAGSGITVTDGGANSTVTVAVAAGAILQVLQTTYATNVALSTVIPTDDTVPQSTEGVQVLSQAITPASASNKILVFLSLWGTTDYTNATSIVFALFRTTTAINVGMIEPGDDNGVTINNRAGSANLVHLDSPATASAVTYSVRVGPGSGGAANPRLNGTAAGRLFGGTSACTLTLVEIKG